MLKRLPKTRWSQPCPCSLSCPVLWEAEAAAIGIAARRRQLWRVIHPRLPAAHEWHREGTSLLPVQTGSALMLQPTCVDTSVSDPIHQCQDCPSRTVRGLGLVNLPPWHKELLSVSAGEIVQSSVHENIVILPLSSDFILLNGCVSAVAFLFDQHPCLFCDYEGVKLQTWIRALCSTSIPMWILSFQESGSAGFLPKFCI